MLQILKKFIFQRFKKSETELHELNYLFWECTTRCNFHCLHCGSDCSQDSRYPDMPFEDFLRALETIKDKAHHFTIAITGGEPLLRKDLEQCGRELRKRGFGWGIVSNGYLYDEERHKSLLNAGIGALTFSLDGLEAEHNWLRNNPNSFECVMKAIDLVVASPRINFDIVTCVNQKNFGQLAQIRDLLISKKVKAWRLFTIIPIGRVAQNPDLSLSDEQLLKLMDYIADNRNKKEIDIKFSCEGYVGCYEGKVRDWYYFCRAGINIGSVLIDGSISACPNIDRSFVQGNIYKDNFYEVWQNKFKPFRDRSWMRVGQCATCREFSKCQGNGFHNWHDDKQNVLVCHNQKIENALRDRALKK